MPGSDHRRAGAVRTLRTLHLVDLPDLVGGGQDGVVEYRDALVRYLAASDWRPGDHVVLGVTPVAALPCIGGLGAPFPMRWASGSHGSSRALLSFATDPRQLARSYDRLALGSGDHRLAPLARVAMRRGVRVDVVVLEGQLSRALAGLATRIVQLPAPRPHVHGDRGSDTGTFVQRASEIAPTPLAPALVSPRNGITSSGAAGRLGSVGVRVAG